MWPFTKTVTLADSGALKGITDCHCHLLPGVDDGVKKLETSLEILKRMEEQGVRKLWLTPHIMEDFPNRPIDLQIRFQEFKAAYQGTIELHLAAEHMLDRLFDERLEADDVLPLDEGKHYLMVETSYFTPPIGLENTLKRILSKGYFPLLAHPERYVYMEKKDYRRLKELNVDFQLNLPCLAGGYGKEVQEKTFWLLKQGFYSLCGSDTHASHFWEHSIHERKFAQKVLKAELFTRK